jgi:hypothetical protein
VSLSSIGQRKTYIGLEGGPQLVSSYIEHSLYTVNLRAVFIPTVHGGLVVKSYDPYRKKGLNTGLQAGLLFTRKGWQQEFLLAPPVNTYLDYINLPIEAIIYTGSERNRIYINMGFFIEALIDHRAATAPADSLISRDDFYTFETSRDRRFGYGLTAAAGFQKEFSFGALYLEGNFSYSISNFIGIAYLALPTPDLSNLFAISVSVGYLIPLKKPSD